MIEFKDQKIGRVSKGEDGVFEAQVECSGEVFRGKKLGLATGVRDMVELEADGFAECWTKGIFHCMFCHGYEERGVESIGLLATGAVNSSKILHHMAPMIARFATKNITIYTNANPSLHSEASTMFKSPKITADDRKISSYSLVGSGPGVMINFEDGTSTQEGFCVGQPKMELRSRGLAEQLGVEFGEDGAAEMKVAQPFFETNVKGCFAAGDAATPMKSALQAISMGGFGGVGMVFQLGAEAEERGEL